MVVILDLVRRPDSQSRGGTTPSLTYSIILAVLNRNVPAVPGGPLCIV